MADTNKNQDNIIATGESRNDDYFLEVVKTESDVLLVEVKTEEETVGTIKYVYPNGNVHTSLGNEIPSWKQAELVQQVIEMSVFTNHKEDNLYGENLSLWEKVKNWFAKKVAKFDVWNYWITH